MIFSKSAALFDEAKQLIPGGVNSPVRACGSVGGQPLFIEKGDKSRLYDADGNAYIDYVLSWGPLILGHRPPSVIQALREVLETGTSFGAPTHLETRLAKMVTRLVPSVDMVRMVNSGTEATMSAIRLARGFTGRDIIIKFDGCYHGHADTLLVAAGSGVATLGIPGSPGIPESVIRNTLSLPYNDIARFKQIMEQKGDQVAGVILEPVAGNMGMVMPKEGFLETLRQETQKYGALLIFDEVMTGFRVAKGSAQGLFTITPDLTCFGKIIGGGLEDAGIPFQTGHAGSMAGFFFTDRKVYNFEDAKTSNLDRFAAFYRGMLQKGIYLAPSQFEACFVSLAHTDQDIADTIAAAKAVMADL
ncbi:MAG: glutamate-1-semialdehyde 2,1-aminomutase [Desulfobacteraceae bacterium]|nr:glutamate-1-semialdehyde 2,1-aminomutase [Desulfobacteraceae bacterium]